MLKQQIEQDLKQALLSGDKDRATTLRGLKSVILYAEVSKGVRVEGLADDEITVLLIKEAKKRQESADFFKKGGADDRAAKELAEKGIIEAYLPQQMSDEDLLKLIDTAIAEANVEGPMAMGKVIGAVKKQAGAAADGSRIAQKVKERLTGQ